MFSLFGTGVKSRGTIKVTIKYRLEESKTWHNFVDAGWRMLGAFHLRALLFSGYINGLMHNVSMFEFGAKCFYVIPSFFSSFLKFQFISQHIKYFVHECMKLIMHEIMTRTCENFKNFASTQMASYTALVNVHWCSHGIIITMSKMWCATFIQVS